ncbi:Uncharacterised protein [uncultured archaeon]|nr:Uncharacterised protein [uncultured archaeon]
MLAYEDISLNLLAGMKMELCYSSSTLGRGYVAQSTHEAEKYFKLLGGIREGGLGAAKNFLVAASAAQFVASFGEKG